MRHKNPNCDNDKCRTAFGEVRLLPTGGGSNAILCRACFDHEILYRVARNMTLDKSCQFDTPSWKDLEVYTV